jgi:hypothetical protein
VLRQFKQHRMARLRTPFFVGTRVSLPFPEGTIDGVMCPFSVSRMMIIVCEHPTRGLIHINTALLGTEQEFVFLCANPRAWNDPFTNALADWPLQMVVGDWFRMLLHEFRLGRYSFGQFLTDVRAREGFNPDTSLGH